MTELPLGKRGPKPKYDWDLYTNGEVHTVVKGTDFTCGPASFRAILHQQAKRVGLVVKTSISDDIKVTFQFYKDTEGTPTNEQSTSGSKTPINGT
jgi:hypothetical protein